MRYRFYQTLDATQVLDDIQNAGVSVKKKYRQPPIIYKNIVAAFDIETSRLPDDQSIMYIWQLQIMDYTFIGRTWEEFTKILDDLRGKLKSK